MKNAAPLIIRKSSCIVLAGAVLLSGCLAGDNAKLATDPTTLSVELPSLIRQVNAVNLDNVTVVVAINGATPLNASRNSAGRWQVAGLVRESYPGDNEVVISWSETVDGDEWLLAEFNGTFVMSNSEMITPAGSFTSTGPRFDIDRDGISNLAERRADGGVTEPETVLVAADCFDMGSPPLELARDTDEGPQFNVCIESFRMGKYEVTYAEYNAFLTATGRNGEFEPPWAGGRQPVVNVSFIDALAYTNWLSQQVGKRYRLPTEAEWEFAARAKTSTPFNTGETISTDQANFDGSIFTYNGSEPGIYRQQTVEVGAFAPNAFGLYDMHGNVREWTCSVYQNPYNGSEQVCDTSSGSDRSIRGGSWFIGPQGVRSAVRNFDSPTERSNTFGFRVVLEI